MPKFNFVLLFKKGSGTLSSAISALLGVSLIALEKSHFWNQVWSILELEWDLKTIAQSVESKAQKDNVKANLNITLYWCKLPYQKLCADDLAQTFLFVLLFVD